MVIPSSLHWGAGTSLFCVGRPDCSSEVCLAATVIVDLSKNCSIDILGRPFKRQPGEEAHETHVALNKGVN